MLNTSGLLITGMTKTLAELKAQQRYRMKSAPKEQNKRARRKYWLSVYKCAKGCHKCAYNADARALDFDHLDDKTKLFTIGNNYMRSLKSLLNEIRKCVVICANCHRIKSHDEQKFLFRKTAKYV